MELVLILKNEVVTFCISSSFFEQENKIKLVAIINRKFFINVFFLINEKQK